MVKTIISLIFFFSSIHASAAILLLHKTNDVQLLTANGQQLAVTDCGMSVQISQVSQCRGNSKALGSVDDAKKILRGYLSDFRSDDDFTRAVIWDPAAQIQQREDKIEHIHEFLQHYCGSPDPATECALQNGSLREFQTLQTDILKIHSLTDLASRDDEYVTRLINDVASSALVVGKFTDDEATGLYSLLGAYVEGDSALSLKKGFVRPEGQGHVLQVVAGAKFACALMDTSKVICWGNTDISLHLPPRLRGVRQIVAGDEYACAATDSRIYCWGKVQVDEPLQLAGRKGLFAGPRAVCAIVLGVSSCWGPFPEAQISGIGNISEMAISYFHACAIIKSQVQCWGKNTLQSNNGTTFTTGQIDVPRDLLNPRHLVLGSFISCAMTDEGERCWGYGSGTGRGSMSPGRKMEVGLNWKEMVYVGTSRCYVYENSGFHCESQESSRPSRLGHPRSLSARYNHACLIADDGVHCWRFDDSEEPSIPNLSIN